MSRARRPLLIAALTAFAAGAVAAAAHADDTPAVLFKTDSTATAQSVAERHHVALSRSFAWTGWSEVRTGSTAERDALRAALQDDPDVRGTDAVAADEQFVPAFQPRDPAWTAGFILPSGESTSWGQAKANFPAAWDLSTGAGQSIGIIDSEFDTTHPDLQAKVRNPYNTSSGSPNYHTGNVTADSVGQLHGTHVAGIAAAVTDNGIGVAGAGFDATFVPAKINTTFQPGNGNPVDGAFVGDLTEALGYMASQSIGVVNMSLGGTRPHQPLADAIAAVRARGVTVVASAGNFQQQSPNAAIYPASYPGVIAVANTQVDNSISPSSSNGNWVDVAAPGTNILSTWETRDPQLVFDPQGAGGNYNAISGTSMASPMVAGLVALMKAKRPDLSPDEVEALLKGTTTDLGSAGVDPQFGAGLINASAAVAAAASYVRPAPPAPAPVPPPPPADTVAPRVTIAGLVTVAGRNVTVRFKCSEACTGKVRVRTTKRRLLASKSFAGRPGKNVAVRLRTPKRLRVRSKIIVEVVAADAAGNLTTLAQRRKLR